VDLLREPHAERRAVLRVLPQVQEVVEDAADRLEDGKARRQDLGRAVHRAVRDRLETDQRSRSSGSSQNCYTTANLDRGCNEKCQAHEAEGWEYLPKVIGVDVARFGENSRRSASGRAVRFPDRGFAKARPDDDGPPRSRGHQKERPVQTFVDASGIGAGVVDRLRQLNFSSLM
jgi:hypothetical protein